MYKPSEGYQLLHNSKPIYSEVVIAGSFYKRLRGLTFFPNPSVDTAFFIPKCSSIHTFFMRFSLDVIFLDRENRIKKLCPFIKPFRFTGSLGSYSAVELTLGSIERLSLTCGDTLEPKKI